MTGTHPVTVAPLVAILQLMWNSNMIWFFSPIKSTDTNSALLADIKPRFPIQPVVIVFSENRRFSCLFSGPLGEVGSLLE